MDHSPEIPLTKRQRYWLNHLQACEASGKGIAEYAREHGLKDKSMYASKKALINKGGLPPTCDRFQRVQMVNPVVANKWLIRSFTPTTDDADGDTLEFSIENKPTWATFNITTGALTGAPVPGDEGTISNIVISVNDQQDTQSLMPFSIAVNQLVTGVATLSWAPPTTNTGGTALTDLAGYKIYRGISQGSYPNVTTVATPGIATYVVENLPIGTHYFVITAYDTLGNQSVFSSEVSKVIN